MDISIDSILRAIEDTPRPLRTLAIRNIARQAVRSLGETEVDPSVAFTRTLSGPAWQHGHISDGRVMRWAQRDCRSALTAIHVRHLCHSERPCLSF